MARQPRALLPVVSAACFVLVLPPTAAVTHYERPPCQGDEVQGEVLGLSGYVCSPRCAEGSYDCPSDVPDLAAARPQCMLKDVDRGAFCALLCTVDSQCPNGARCNRLEQAGVGVCMYPLAFSDWVRQGNTRRLSFGLPQRADKKLPPGVVQKAVAAVQNLKSKYGIQDGDADVVTVKEFLTVLSGAVAPGTGMVQQSAGFVPAAVAAPSLPALPYTAAAIPTFPPAAIPTYPPAAVYPPATVIGATVTASPPVMNRPGQTETGKILDAYQRDLTYHSENLRNGLPGLTREVTDAVYDLENFEEKHNLSNLLRHLIEISLVYLIVGVVYKHQALGASGVDMIPHIGFWMEYPKLVEDGFKYSSDVVGGYLGMDLSSSGFSGSSSFSGGGSGGFEPLGRGERDTFAHFEPSKA